MHNCKIEYLHTLLREGFKIMIIITPIEYNNAFIEALLTATLVVPVTPMLSSDISK